MSTVMERSRIPEDWLSLSTSRTFDRGLSVDESVECVSTLAVSHNSSAILVSSLVEQLCRLFHRDPKEQQRIYLAICSKLKDMRLIDDSYKFKELSTLRGHYRQAVVQCMNSRIVNDPLLETSRYNSDFDELQWLSSGGFGQVYRVRHRLDQMEYAIKKIKVRYKDTGVLIRTLGEVKTLAKLNHKNIVQYKAAWLEVAQYPVSVPDTDTSAEESDGVVFEDSTSDDSEDNNDQDKNLPVCAYRPKPSRLTQLGAVLYVKMQLCDRTIRQWLDERNSSSIVNHRLLLDIMKQTTSGIEYIHSKNVIHHDIKPSNIFISRGSLVQVGDFGLSCNAKDGRSSCPLRFGQRGTSLYAAPEQLRGHCHQQSDIYSLGLVLLELLTPFTTDMERVAVLTAARAGRLPSGLMPPLQDLLKDLTSSQLLERPSATALLKRLQIFDCLAVDDKDLIIAELRRQLAMKDKQVRRLQRRIKNSESHECDY